MNIPGLNNTFNTTFKEEPVAEEHNSSASALTPAAESVLPTALQPPSTITLENKKFVKNELECLIRDCTEVISDQKDSMKEDAKASTLMAFADLVRTTRDLLHELNEMDRTENELNMRSNKAVGIQIPPGGNLTVNNFSFTGKELVDKLIEFRKQSEMNDIGTDFNTLEDAQLEDDTE